MSLNTVVYTAGLSLAYKMFATGELDVMTSLSDSLGAYLGEMAADKIMPATDYADTAGAAAGAYGIRYWIGNPDIYCAIAGGLGQKLGDMYPIPQLSGTTSKSE